MAQGMAVDIASRERLLRVPAAEPMPCAAAAAEQKGVMRQRFAVRAQIVLDESLDAGGKGDDPLLVALATDAEKAAREIHVLHAKGSHLCHAQSRPTHEREAQPVPVARDRFHEAVDLFRRQKLRQSASILPHVSHRNGGDSAAVFAGVFARPVGFCNKRGLLLQRFRNISGKKGRKKSPRFCAGFHFFSADFFESFGDFELDF